MQKISSILVPFDFSKSALKALEYTVNFIGDSAIDVYLLTISEADVPEHTEQQQALSRQYNAKLKRPLQWITEEGGFSETIMKVKTEKNAQLVVMGTSGLQKEGGPTHTSQMVMETDCPVIVVPENTDRTEVYNISLVIGNKEIDAPKALSVLLEIARKHNAKVHVLSVQNTEETMGYSEVDEKNENTLLYYLEDFYSEHTFTENQDIIEGIFNYTDSHDIDMIAVLPRNHAKRAIPSKGLLTKELVLQSKIPVLTIE